MLRTLRRWLGTPPHAPHEVQILVRLDRLERSEVERNAEHAAMIDRLDRLYKRISARISREDAPEPTIAARQGSESPLDLKRRLRGT